ncbi:MAG: hypothetical protein JNK15_18450 [Planctomycetes bacterium]|nr:hypothetical protein [Planctomycetota bacterium]
MNPSQPNQDSPAAPALAIGTMLFAIAAAVTLGQKPGSIAAPTPGTAWLQAIETGADHIEPRALASELLAAPSDLVLVDLRPANEFATWHLPGALNMTVPDVCGEPGQKLFAAKPRLVVLYSNGPAHPGQAWVALNSAGHSNVKVLAGGLDDFKTQVLTPPSLRPDTDEATAKAELATFTLTRAFFLGDPAPKAPVFATDPTELARPTMVSAKWLHDHLGKVAVLDLRSARDFAALHVPGAQRLDLAKIRQKHDDRDLHFVADDALAAAFGALGLTVDTPVVLCADDKQQDPTMAAMALLRLGHRSLAILEGGMLRWATERRPLVAATTTPKAAKYEPRAGADDFTITTDALAAAVTAGSTKVLDVRPPEFFRGDKSTEARPGHIPGAVNRLYSKDVVRQDDGSWLRPAAELRKDYEALGLSGKDPIVVSCRTGHTASHTYFVLRHLLGYENVRWYAGSWTEWAERKDLPAATGDK